MLRMYAQDRRVPRVFQVARDPKDPKDPREPRVFLEPLQIRALKGFKGQPDFKAARVSREVWALHPL